MSRSTGQFLRDGEPGKEQAWRVKDIRWREVFKRQDWANWIFSAFLIVAIIVIVTTATPHQRPYFITDASISYTPHSNTIPSWVAVLVPFVMLVSTVLVGELIHSRKDHNNVTDAVATALFFILDGVQSFIMGLLLTETFKNVAGRLRPGFLYLCQPQVPSNTQVTVSFVAPYGTDPDASYPCANDDNDSRKSFPSGHASISFNLAVYASAYLIWCWHMRRAVPLRTLTFWEEFKLDLSNVVAKVWMLGMLCFAWGVAVSRTIDYQHNYSDVLGGMFLGTMIALVYALRAIPRYRRVCSPTVTLNGTAAGQAGYEVDSTGAWAGTKHSNSTEMVQRHVATDAV